MLKHQLWLLYLPVIAFLSSFQITGDPDNKVIRRQLLMGVNSKRTTDSLYNKLTSLKSQTAIITGYIGTLQALKAKHTWNPYNKLKFLNQAESSFTDAISHDPDNMEIRFMRFSVEYNVPGFLGYNKNLGVDKAAMLRQIELHRYERTDKELLQTVIKFLIDSGKCTFIEIDILRKQLITLK